MPWDICTSSGGFFLFILLGLLFAAIPVLVGIIVFLYHILRIILVSLGILPTMKDFEETHPTYLPSKSSKKVIRVYLRKHDSGIGTVNISESIISLRRFNGSTYILGGNWFRYFGKISSYRIQNIVESKKIVAIIPSTSLPIMHIDIYYRD